MEYNYVPDLESAGFTILESASFSFWIPDSLGEDETVRGVIAISDFIINRYLFFDPRWRELAEKLKFGLLLQQVTEPRHTFKLSRGEEGLKAIFHAMEYFSEVSGHPEVKYSGLIHIGPSEAAFQAPQFAFLNPQRTIAVIAVHGSPVTKHIEVLDGPLGLVPRLQVMCETDRYTPSYRIYHFLLEGRKYGALWTSLYQGKVPHDRIGQPDFMIKWIEDVVKLRVPENIPRDKLPEFKAISDKDGYLGYLQLKSDGTLETSEDKLFYAPYSEYQGDKSKACWIPSEELARLWHEYNLREDAFDHVLEEIMGEHQAAEAAAAQAQA
ncbi:hypothetical protein GF312_02770 [Candidatus Poribacteria bacterium]|nr:hypothetical protein [Candidatus Poribacteria bacterium]